MSNRLTVCATLAILVTTCAASFAQQPSNSRPPVASADDVKCLIRVDVTFPSVVAGLGQTLRSWDTAGSADAGRLLDLIVTDQDRLRLDAAGVPYTLLIPDIERAQAHDRATYHTFPQVESLLSTLAATYPAITNLTSLGLSAEGRNLWCLEISDNPGVDEGEVGVVFLGLHHAREWPGLEMCLELATRLTDGYGVNPTLTSLINNRRIWIIPCVNPDGYVYCHDQGHDWRKNRRYFPEFATTGVDLNRNYAGATNGVPAGQWGSIGTGSQTHNPAEDIYVGPMPFSEPETQAIRDFCRTHDFTVLITYHTYGELVLWPWGYDAASQADDNVLLTTFGQGLAAQITRQGGSGTYTPQAAAALYPTTGDGVDWAYGEQYYRFGRGVLAYTIEMGAIFQPSVAELQQVLDENWNGALYALQQAAAADSQLASRVLPPLLTTPPQDDDGNFTVSWSQQNPAAGADHYELQELTGFAPVTDGAETGTAHWTLEQFARSTARQHAGTYSFKSPPGSEVIAAMTTQDPLPVSSGDQLSFWTWYSIEQNWDMAFVEVSIDGRAFDVLDAFTGDSDWVQKVYSLDAYAGESIYIRFRYTTDGFVEGEGFYIDDIAPVATWTSIATLDDDITATDYTLTARPSGDYYYRVRGSNPAHGFGDFTALQRTQVASTVCRGDTNCDGRIDFGDINPFVEALLHGEYCDGTGANVDVNGNGTVGFDDINPFVTLLVTAALPATCP